MDGDQIRVVNNIKYLGIKWTEKMGCKEHILEQIQIVKNTFFSLATLTRTKNGLEC